MLAMHRHLLGGRVVLSAPHVHVCMRLQACMRAYGAVGVLGLWPPLQDGWMGVGWVSRNRTWGDPQCI